MVHLHKQSLPELYQLQGNHHRDWDEIGEDKHPGTCELDHIVSIPKISLTCCSHVFRFLSVAEIPVCSNVCCDQSKTDLDSKSQGNHSVCKNFELGELVFGMSAVLHDFGLMPLVHAHSINKISILQLTSSEKKIVDIQRNSLRKPFNLRHSFKLVDCVVRAFALDGARKITQLFLGHKLCHHFLVG